MDLKARLESDGLFSLRGAIGTPKQIRKLLLQYEEAGVDQVIFISQAGKNRHEDICESMELFANEVMPEFAERDPAHQTAKAKKLAPAVEAALSRREGPRAADPDYRLAMPEFPPDS